MVRPACAARPLGEGKVRIAASRMDGQVGDRARCLVVSVIEPGWNWTAGAVTCHAETGAV